MATITDSKLWAVTGLMFIMSPITANVAAEDCKGISIQAPAASQNEIQDMCTAALHAKKLLSQCGIEQSQDLNIIVVEKLSHPTDLPVFAFFHSPSNQIIITDYENFKKLIYPNSAYHKLPGYDLYKSLIAHEVTHAITFQNSAEKDRSRVGHEYIAAVIQVASMSNDTRQVLLNTFPRTSPVKLEMFNLFSLYAAPHWFVANAYRHYSGMDDGCEFLRNIIKGDIHFPSLPE